MQFKTISKLTTATLFSLLTFTSAWGQNYVLPDAHNADHQNYLAEQQNIQEQIKVKETQQYLDILLNEEDIEPEIDIYTEGWDSQLVNCYKNTEVPDRKEIDVTNFCIPCPGHITSRYGYRRRFRRMHKGIDIKAQTGDTIYAAFDGKVRITRYERRGYGYYVVLRHTNDLETVYGHLSKFLVEPNQVVKAGEPIALAGNTGRSFGSHLHFETRYMGYAINPEAIFDFENKTTHTDTYVFDKNTYQKARNYAPKGQQLAQDNDSNKTKAKASTKKSSKKKTYTIRKGDTLSKIAARNGVSVKQICRLNGISTTTKLRPGKKLKLN